MTSILTYHVQHRRDFKTQLQKAQLIADYAVQHKKKPKELTSRLVKAIGLPSAISNQILRKYGRGTIKTARNVNLIIPGQGIKYNQIQQTITLTPLKISFRWNCGRSFKKINQVEIDSKRFMVSVTFDNSKAVTLDNILSLDLNCGFGRHVINAVDHQAKHVLNLGKQGPHLRHKYYKLRRQFQQNGEFSKVKEVGDREKRILKDLDHKMSLMIVDYAEKKGLRIVMEDLSGIRNSAKKAGNGSRTKNRLVNSWSFYRLQQFIQYKSKLRGIPVDFVPPHYTSQTCSYCKVLGIRNKEIFQCHNRKCGKRMHADVNAAYCVGKRWKGEL